MNNIKEIYNGAVIDVRVETAKLPDGHVMDFECVRHSGGATIAAVDEEQNVCLIRQYRHCAGGWLLELPAGKIDRPEPPDQTARRELKEETGITAASWHYLGGVYSSPGFCDEIIHCYLATGLQAGQSALEAGELIELEWIPMNKAVKLALNGELRDAKSVVCLLRARQWLENRG